jgi:F like protein
MVLFMPSREAEDNVYQAAKNGLQRWLGVAKEAVMAPWKRFRATPNADAIRATVPVWQTQVDRILEALTPALREGWAAAHLPGDFDPGDPYIVANLAMTYNLLVRIPDEVHAKVVKEILEGTNAGESTEQIAQRVDNVLEFSGSENWVSRARTIATTETTRNFGSSMLAHGLLTEKNGRQGLTKQWDTVMDGKERMAHQLANNQTQPLNQPFIVDGELLMHPAAPNGSPDNVIGCRCSLRLLNGAS